MTKYDDSDWHVGDAKNEIYAAVHIALMFCWLLNNGYVKQSFLDEAHIDIPLSQKRTPTEYLYYYADGKLFDDFLTENGKKLCDAYYEKYMADYAERNIKGVKYARLGDSPYAGKDKWKNVRVLDSYFAKIIH
jgi:hypothetical protein